MISLSEEFLDSLSSFLYMLLNLFTFGKLGNTKWGAWLVASDTLEAFNWIESRDLENKVCYIDTEDGHRHYRTETEPRHVSFWRDEDNDNFYWKGGFYETGSSELICLLKTMVNCPYVDRKRKELLNELAEKAEPWWNVVDYERDVPSWAKTMEKSEFKRLSNVGILSDSHGFGLLVKDGKMSVDYKVMPSSADEGLAEDATHVAWISSVE